MTQTESKRNFDEGNARRLGAKWRESYVSDLDTLLGSSFVIVYVHSLQKSYQINLKILVEATKKDKVEKRAKDQQEAERAKREK